MRGGGSSEVSLDEAEEVAATEVMEIIDIDAALNRLAELDERKSRILELHYFGGLTYEEMAEPTVSSGRRLRAAINRSRKREYQA